MIKPKKHLAQYFLRDKKVLGQIVKAADLRKNSIVLEVGPGTGILTKKLLAKCKKVIAVEKDKEMINFLDKNIKSKNLKLIHQDVLKLGLRRYRIKQNSLKIVANLPYYLTGAFLFKFAGHFMVLLVQKEMAQRIVSKKGSLLSIGVKSWARPKIISYVPNTAFWPRPKVDSAIIKLVPLEKTNRINFKLLKTSFNQKRKQLGNTLDKALLAKAGIDSRLRPEDLSVQDWVKLSRIK